MPDRRDRATGKDLVEKLKHHFSQNWAIYLQHFRCDAGGVSSFAWLHFPKCRTQLCKRKWCNGGRSFRIQSTVHWLSGLVQGFVEIRKDLSDFGLAAAGVSVSVQNFDNGLFRLWAND